MSVLPQVTTSPSSKGSSIIRAETFALNSTLVLGSISPGALTNSINSPCRAFSMRTKVGLPSEPDLALINTPITEITTSVTITVIITTRDFFTLTPFLKNMLYQYYDLNVLYIKYRRKTSSFVAQIIKKIWCTC